MYLYVYKKLRYLHIYIFINLLISYEPPYEHFYKPSACLATASLRLPVVRNARRALLAASALWRSNIFKNSCTNTFVNKHIYIFEQNDPPPNKKTKQN